MIWPGYLRARILHISKRGRHGDQRRIEGRTRGGVDNAGRSRECNRDFSGKIGAHASRVQPSASPLKAGPTRGFSADHQTGESLSSNGFPRGREKQHAGRVRSSFTAVAASVPLAFHLAGRRRRSCSPGQMVPQEVADDGAFGDALLEIADFDEDVVLLEACFFAPWRVRRTGRRGRCAGPSDPCRGQALSALHREYRPFSCRRRPWRAWARCRRVCRCLTSSASRRGDQARGRSPCLRGEFWPRASLQSGERCRAQLTSAMETSGWSLRRVRWSPAWIPAALAAEPVCHRLDFGDVVGGQCDAECLNGRLWIDPFDRNGLALTAVVRAEGVSDHVTVNAALHDLAVPVELARILGGERGKLDGLLVRHGAALLAVSAVLLAG
jgi:hypothetical protein